MSKPNNIINIQCIKKWKKYFQGQKSSLHFIYIYIYKRTLRIPTKSKRRSLITSHRFNPPSDTSHMKTAMWPALNGENIDCSHLKDDSGSCKSIYLRISVTLAWPCVAPHFTNLCCPSGSFFMNIPRQRSFHCRLWNALILKSAIFLIRQLEHKCELIYLPSHVRPVAAMWRRHLVQISRARRRIEQCILSLKSKQWAQPIQLYVLKIYSF